MTAPLDPIDLRTLGFSALVESLGRVNAVPAPVRNSIVDYTAERDTLLPDLPAAELIRRTTELE